MHDANSDFDVDLAVELDESLELGRSKKINFEAKVNYEREPEMTQSEPEVAQSESEVAQSEPKPGVVKKPLIKLERASKTYKRKKEFVRALKSVSLEIGAGEFVILSGVSGSGKTTLLKVIGGLERATDGKVLFGGVDISKLHEKELVDFRRRQIAMIFQDYFLDPNLSFRENIELPAVFAEYTPEERNKRTHELVNGTDLEGRLEHLPEEISGGQTQRAAILRALYLRPRVILADEPTSNIDEKNVFMVLDMLREAQKNGATIIIASHDSRVTRYADRVIKIDAGELVG